MTKLKSLHKGLHAAALGLLLVATGALAQSTDIWTTDFQKTFMTEKMMHMIDTSGHGMVSKADYDTYMGKVFDMMDKNHKGMLDKHDYMAVESGSTNIWTTDFQKAFRSEAMMHTMDGGKGMVSKADFMKHMDMIFDKLDKNHDGMLEKDEFMYDTAFHVTR